MHLEVLLDHGDTLRTFRVHTSLLTALLYTTFAMASLKRIRSLVLQILFSLENHDILWAGELEKDYVCRLDMVDKAKSELFRLGA